MDEGLGVFTGSGFGLGPFSFSAMAKLYTAILRLTKTAQPIS
jgi:hypothetical protein